MDPRSILILNAQVPIDLAVCEMIFLISRRMNSGKAKVTQIGMEQGRISTENI
jgi:hypothetical protein